jgi:muramoyltetrapeptide carboxypeptidase
LKKAGKLSKLKGLVVGGFTSNKDTDRPFGKNIEQVIYDVVQEFTFPICFGFPISHEKENVAIIVGGMYRLDVSVHGTTLSSC